MTLVYINYFQILSLLLAIIFYKSLRSFKLLGFIPLLSIVCIVEVLAVNSDRFGLHGNRTIYDIYLIVSTPVLFYIYLQMLAYKGLTRRLYIALGFLLFIFTGLNMLFLQGPVEFDTYSLILVEFITAILSLLVIAKLFQEEDTSIMLNYHPYFWIGASTLIFSAVTLIVLGMSQFFLVRQVKIGGEQIYRVIMPMVNVVLYSSYSYAFYLCRKLTNRSSRQ